MAFKKGQSGNPGGVPARGRTIKLSDELRKMITDEAPFIISRLIFSAKNGDIAAIKLCLERIFPKNADIRETFVKLSIPNPDRTQIEQLADMGAEVDARTSSGEISLESAQMLYDIIEKKRKLLETLELEGRMARLEACDNKIESAATGD